jgi:outer membrane protein assembly factor BamB
LSAFSARSGDVQWTAMVEAAVPWVVGDGQLFAADASAIRAFDAASGTASWSVPMTSPLAAGLAWEAGWLVAGTTDGVVMAFSGTDGREIWRRDLGEPLTARPTIAGERLLLPRANGITALVLRTGEPLWHTRLGGAAHEALAVGHRIYAGSNDNFFYCLNGGTGRVEWRFRTGADAIGLPAADDDRVYFVALDNVLRALDLGNGAQRWKQALPLRPVTGPLRVGTALLVSGLGPMLYAYGTADGAAAGDVTVPGDIVAPPLEAVTAGVPAIFVVARDIAKGDSIHAIGRAIEPAIQPVAPLPNPVLLPPPVPEAAPPPAPTRPAP